PRERDHALWLVRLDRHRRAPRRLERISRQSPRRRRPRRQTQALRRRPTARRCIRNGKGALRLHLCPAQQGIRNPAEARRLRAGHRFVRMLMRPMTPFAVALVLLSALVCGRGIAADGRPDIFSVTRSTAIKATPEKIQALLADFHGWREWSPWERMDSGMKRNFGGAPSGKGATYAWEGNAEVGQGRMEITECLPDKVTLNLDLVRPFQAHYRLEFSLVPKGSTTEVTWSMVGSMTSVPKLMQLFVDMERMVGPKFESGLANLKSLTEN